jgi:hypothetical protein
VPTDDDGVAHDIPDDQLGPDDHDVNPGQYVNHHHGPGFHRYVPDEHLDDHLDNEHVDDHDVDHDDDNDRGAGAAPGGVADSYRR